MAKVLVTGGAGFIGSHLVEHLLQNNEVIIIDNFSMGKRKNLPKGRPRLKVFDGSILDENIGFLFKGVDTVFHLAALTRPRYSIDYPVETNRVNVEGTVKVLKHCLDNEVKKVIFISSASVYGDQKVLPFSETAVPNPKSPYALTKLIGESYCRLFGKLYGLKFNIVRPFNVYGTRQSIKGGYAAAVPNFIETLKKRGTPFITGDGKQVRDFVYIDDVVKLMIAVSKSNAYREVFNAGSGKNISINDMYKTICRIMKKDTKPNYVEPIVEPETLADIDKAKRLLDWEPKVDLEEGLRRTIEGTI